MNNITSFFVLTVTLLTTASFSAPADAALVRYTYTGNPFDDVNYAPFSGEHFTEVRIDFTLDDVLVPKNGRFELPEIMLETNDYLNEDLSTLTPLRSFIISDGHSRIDGALINRTLDINNYKSISLAFQTDSGGNVSGNWQIQAYSGYSRTGDSRYKGSTQNGDSWAFIQSNAFNSSTQLDYDRADFVHSFYYRVGVATFPNNGTINNNPGTWTRTLIGVPLPGALLLFASALAGLCLNRSLSSQRH